MLEGEHDASHATYEEDGPDGVVDEYENGGEEHRPTNQRVARRLCWLQYMFPSCQMAIYHIE